MSGNNGIGAVIYPAAFTLLGVFITSTISWISAAQTASINNRQMCVNRLDAKESTIRSKTEAFLSAQGGIIALAAHKTHDINEVEKAIDETVRTGYALSSYFDGQLAATTELLALKMSEKLDPKTPIPTKEQSEEHIKLMDDWSSLYRQLLLSLEQARKNC
ncbi:hypothetical protein ACF8Q9_22200 [Pseudomonas sp. TYF_15]|uniref:hypothetical protein n=1 Tax=Pseudomonas sp. TYF_15 TaxID=3367194 RepID=UPI00370ACF78